MTDFRTDLEFRSKAFRPELRLRVQGLRECKVLPVVNLELSAAVDLEAACFGFVLGALLFTSSFSGGLRAGILMSRVLQGLYQIYAGIKQHLKLKLSSRYVLVTGMVLVLSSSGAKNTWTEQNPNCIWVISSSLIS